jgi:hypothetical protein
MYQLLICAIRVFKKRPDTLYTLHNSQIKKNSFSICIMGKNRGKFSLLISINNDNYQLLDIIV